MAELNEVVAEAAEGVAASALDVAVASRAFTGRDARYLIGGLLVGAATSAFVTMRLMDKKYQAMYAAKAEEEIDAMRDHFRKRLAVREEKPELKTPQDLGIATEELGYSVPVAPKPPVPVGPRPQSVPEALEQAQNETDSEGWNWEFEKSHRMPDNPYIIHVEEWGETGDLDSIEYTYYANDDVVVDANGNIIGDRDRVIGDHHLERFGHGSGDPNVVYIRNVYLGLEIQVIRSFNDYTEEVHGGFKHSEEPPRRRRRPSYDDER